MLIKISDTRYLNGDYIVCLALEGTKIIARMIDNSSQLLLELEDDSKANKEFQRLIRETNKRIKEIKYE